MATVGRRNRLHVTVFILTLWYVPRLVIFSCAMRDEISDGRKNRQQLGTDRLLRPKGGRWFWRGGTILKQAPFGGVNFSLVKNMRGVKFYDTATAV